MSALRRGDAELLFLFDTIRMIRSCPKHSRWRYTSSMEFILWDCCPPQILDDADNRDVEDLFEITFEWQDRIQTVAFPEAFWICLMWEVLLLYAVRRWWYRRNLLKIGQDQRQLWSLVTWFVFLQLNWVTWMRNFQFEPFCVFCKLVSKDSVFWSSASGTAKIFVFKYQRLWLVVESLSDSKDKIFISYFGNCMSEKDKHGGYLADFWASHRLVALRTFYGHFFFPGGL